MILTLRTLLASPLPLPMAPLERLLPLPLARHPLNLWPRATIRSIPTPATRQRFPGGVLPCLSSCHALYSVELGCCSPPVNFPHPVSVVLELQRGLLLMHVCAPHSQSKNSESKETRHEPKTILAAGERKGSAPIISFTWWSTQRDFFFCKCWFVVSWWGISLCERIPPWLPQSEQFTSCCWCREGRGGRTWPCVQSSHQS